MTLREQLASVPRWRVGLIAFVAGVLVAGVVAMVALAQGFVSPPVEREVTVQTVVRERVVTKVAKRANVVTTTTSTPGLLRVPDGGVLLAYTTTSTTRDTSTEDSTTDASRAADTSQKSTERPVLPSWTIGVLVGGQFAGKPALSIPQAPGLVLGIEAGYRVPLDRIGVAPRYSLWLEAWGTTSGAAGGGLRGEF